MTPPLQNKKFQSICIFCALRLQTSGARTFPPRRLFQSGRRVYRPPVTATALIGEGYSSASTSESQQLNGHRVKLIALEPNGEAPQLQGPGQTIPASTYPEIKISYVEAGLVTWRCWSCNKKNLGTSATCEICGRIKDSRTKFIKKNTSLNDIAAENLKTEHERIEKSQQERLEQTKNGGFIKYDHQRIPRYSYRSPDIIKSTAQNSIAQALTSKPPVDQHSLKNAETTNGSRNPSTKKLDDFIRLISNDHQRIPRYSYRSPDVIDSTAQSSIAQALTSKPPVDQNSFKNVEKANELRSSPTTKSGDFINLRPNDQAPNTRFSYGSPDIIKSTAQSSITQALTSKPTVDQHSLKIAENINQFRSPPTTKSDELVADQNPLSGGWKKWTPPPQEHSLKSLEVPTSPSSTPAKAETSNGTKNPSESKAHSVADTRHLKSEEYPSKDSSLSHESSLNQQTPATQETSVTEETSLREEIPVTEETSMTQETSDPQLQDSEVPRLSKALSSFHGVEKNYPEAAVSTVSSAPALKRNKKNAPSFSDYDEDMDDRAARRIEKRLERKKEKARQRLIASPMPVHLPEYITVSNLAALLKVRVEDFGGQMRALGFDETNNDHILDAETAALVATEFNFNPIVDNRERQDLVARPPAEDKSHLPARPPIVTIMGHVDHGKTTLLDWLRKSSVAASEHGGITQHIGAFSVAMPSGRLITFLDTPGHAAFLSMRKRGANVTDIVILVVAADDSVKPQTIEAIKHSQAAKVPIIVAINKVDKDDSDIERVKQDLSRYGVEIEDYGGDTQVVCVSGKTGQGMQELEDATIALADILDMRAEVDGKVEGWVLEARKKKAGLVATVLVRRGTFKPGDVIVAGSTWAKVRSLRNEAGAQVVEAGPGTPVEIDGWRKLPMAGDEVLQANDERQAKSVVEHRIQLLERSQMAADMTAVNESRRLEQEKREEEANQDTEIDKPIFKVPESQPGIKEVFFVIKADVSGSVEAILESVSALGNSEVRPHILSSGVGPVIEFDVEHAASAKGHIISFNTPIDAHIARMAESAGVEIMNENIIYRLIDDVKAKLSDNLGHETIHKVLGEAEIAQIFEINVRGRVMMPIAGCKVRNGLLNKTKKVKVVRDGEIVHDGSLSSLKNVKKDVVEMRKGTECGVAFEGGWTDFLVGDLVQSYEEIVEKRTL